VTQPRSVDDPSTRRVLAFTPTFLPGFKAGGPIKSMRQVLEYLPESVHVTLATADRDLGDPTCYPGLSGKVAHCGQHDIFYLNKRNLRQWVTLVRRARLVPSDLLYLNSLWSPWFTVLPVVMHSIGLLATTRVLVAPRGELSNGALDTKPKKKRAFLRLWGPVLRRIDPTWQASTEHERQDILRTFPWAKTLVAADSQGDKPQEAIVGSQHRARFVFIGRVCTMKNLSFALEALALLRADADFDIYGTVEDAAYWAVCERLITSLPHNVKATYRGPLLPDKVIDTFAQYDAFIMPTKGENYGHAISESLSAGCPVICSDRTPWTSLLSSGAGAALPLSNLARWADNIEARAISAAPQRDRSKRLALSAYAEWRQGEHPVSAVALVLDRNQGWAGHPHCSRAPRIALVTQGYHTAGGVQSVARWLSNALRGAGFAVHIFDLASSRSDAQSRQLSSPSSWRSRSLLHSDMEPNVTSVGANGVEVEALRYLPRTELSRELRRFDLVQVVAGGPALALAATRSRRPIVIQVATRASWERGAQPAPHFSGIRLWRSGMTKVVSQMERLAIRRADAVLVENRAMQEWVADRGQTRAVLAPPGVDINCFTPRAQGWNASGYLLSVCRLADPRKGLDRLIRSYATMVQLQPSLPILVLAGRGMLPTSTATLITELNLSERVLILPNVPQGRLPSLYRAASTYLQASYEEGLGLSVLEAMASGLPVVSTDTAGTRETVVHGRTGWLVPQGPALQGEMAARAISIWQADACTMPRYARERAVSLFSSEVALSRYLKIYGEVLPARPTASDG
jgi:glycosyltransferase involved in cell wall biosynthesis